MSTYYAKLKGTAFCDTNRNEIGADNANVNWPKTVAIYCVAVGQDGRNVVASSWKLQWRVSGGAFADLAAGSGAVRYTSATTLSDTTTVTSGEAKVTVSNMTWQNGEEVEDGVSASIDLGSDYYTEIQYGIDFTYADEGSTYQFQVIDVGLGTAIAVESGSYLEVTVKTYFEVNKADTTKVTEQVNLVLPQLYLTAIDSIKTSESVDYVTSLSVDVSDNAKTSESVDYSVITLIFDEGFEGTGYEETSAGVAGDWFEEPGTTGSINEDYSVATLEGDTGLSLSSVWGSQCCRIAYSTSGTSTYLYNTFDSTKDTIYGRFDFVVTGWGTILDGEESPLFNLNSSTSSLNAFFVIHRTGDNYYLRWYYTAQAGYVDTLITLNTRYRVDFKWIRNTATTGTEAKVDGSSIGTATSGDTDVSYFAVADYTSGLRGSVVYFDNVQFDVSDWIADDVVGTLTKSVSNAVRISELIEVVLPELNLEVSDSILTSESVEVIPELNLEVSDSILTSESVEIIPELNLEVSDSILTSELIEVVLPELDVGITDSILTSELAEVLLPELNLQGFDSIRVTEAPDYYLQINIEVSSNTNISESTIQDLLIGNPYFSWGEETPDSDEGANPWSQWRKSDGTRVTTDSWGALGISEACFGPVLNLGYSGLKGIEIQKDKYDTGVGTPFIYVRGHSTTPFDWDAISPSWEVYTDHVCKDWTYVQIQLTATAL